MHTFFSQQQDDTVLGFKNNLILIIRSLCDTFRESDINRSILMLKCQQSSDIAYTVLQYQQL